MALSDYVYKPILNILADYLAPKVKSFTEQYIRSPQGEMFPQALYKIQNPQLRQQAYADLFTSAAMGATNPPIARPGMGSMLRPLSSKYVPPTQAGKGIFKNITEIPNYDDLLMGKPSGADRGKTAKVVQMTPDEYLAQIPEVAPTKSSIDYMKAKLARGEKLPMASLDFSGGKLFGQEGRNRAYLAKEMGLKEMPVLKISSSQASKGVTLSQIPSDKLDLGIPLDIESVYGSSKIQKVASDYQKGNINPIEITKEGEKYILTDGRARYWFSKLNNIDWPVRVRK